MLHLSLTWALAAEKGRTFLLPPTGDARRLLVGPAEEGLTGKVFLRGAGGRVASGGGLVALLGALAGGGAVIVSLLLTLCDLWLGLLTTDEGTGGGGCGALGGLAVLLMTGGCSYTSEYRMHWLAGRQKLNKLLVPAISLRLM